MANYGKRQYLSDGPHTTCSPKDTPIRVDTVDLDRKEDSITHDPMWVAIMVIAVFCVGLFLFVAGRMLF